MRGARHGTSWSADDRRRRGGDRSIPICRRCGSDERWEEADAGRGIGWGLSSAGEWPVPGEVIEERCERYKKLGKLVCLDVNDDSLITEDGVATVIVPCDTGGWAQYGFATEGRRR